MNTIKAFIEYSHIEPKLIRAVIRQVGGWDSFKELAADVTKAGASAGFSGFIYYSDTVAFTKRNKAVILSMAKDIATNIGDPSAVECIAGFRCLDLRVDEVAEAIHNPRSESRQEVFNALAWFSLEEVCHSYADHCWTNERVEH